MNDLVRMALRLYEDAVMYDAECAFGSDPKAREKAEVAWSRYEGAKTLLAVAFDMTYAAVDDEMELLMTEKVA